MFLPDLQCLPADERDQQSDGPIEFHLSNGFVFHAQPETETMNVVVAPGPMPSMGESYSFAEVGLNDFWSTRTKRPIVQVDVLQSLYNERNEFGVEFFLDGGESFAVEYSSEDPAFDQLRITGPYSGPSCSRISVF